MKSKYYKDIHIIGKYKYSLRYQSEERSYLKGMKMDIDLYKGIHFDN